MTRAFIADCGHEIPALPANYTGGTGYGLDAHGKSRCYACCGDADRAELLRTSRAILYFVNTQIVNWPRSLRFDVFNIKRSKGTAFGHRYEVVTGRFRGPEGSLWAFRNAGDTQSARCMRIKEPS
jgi:hypothetical protein